jgi:hypothetical protein
MFRMKTPKKSFFLLALVVTTLMMALSIGIGTNDYSAASIFTYETDGSQVDDQGNVWYVPGYDYQTRNGGRARVMFHAPLNRTMVLTKMMANDPQYPPTCNQTCATLIGSNGLPMKCVDNVDSFPYLGNSGGKLFYPHARTRVSTFPGHGAHGGNYDIVCLGGSYIGDTAPSSTCSHTEPFDTITTCPQCAKNMSPGESVAWPSNFADGAIVACAESQGPLVATQGGTTSSGSVSDIADDLQLALTFDRLDARDSSGKGRNGSTRGGVAFTTEGCRKGGCARLDGIDDYIDANNVYDISGDVTVSAWVRAGVQSGPTRIFDTQSDSDVGVNVYYDAGRFVLDNGGGPSTVVASSAGFEDNNLHHVAVVRNASDYTLYVDGAIVGSVSGSKPIYSGYTLGRSSTGSGNLNATVDEFYVISRALNTNEVNSLMNSGITIKNPIGTVVALPAAVDTTEVNGAFVVEVSAGETGTSQCAKQGKVCVGGSLTNRQACTDFYPHALKTNKSEGYASDFKCTGGSTQTSAPCADILEDTCTLAVSTGDVFQCDEPLKDGVDTAFIECEDPFSPQLLNEVGGFLPPISTPALDPLTGLVPYGVTVSHPLDQSTTVTVEYRIVGEEENHLASLSPAKGNADVSVGVADQDTDLTPQIGSEDRIDTDENEEVTVNFNWDPSADLTDITGAYVIVITVTDLTGNTTTDVSPEFVLDPDNLISNVVVIAAADPNDLDGDGTPNSEDPDIDGDGIANIWDTDVDGDAVSNALDDDDDADAVLDDSDDSPTGLGTEEDIDGDGILNETDTDIDGDGLLNGVDPDMDGDGIPNAQDDDIDGDGVLNVDDPDMDGDGVPNTEDTDMDGDGFVNGLDPDVDGDGINNGLDPDVDGDGISNGIDPDVDGDGIANGLDPDVDGDASNPDADIDGDGILNVNDSDVDGDGITNGLDPDVDGDGITNGFDLDVDGDGIPNELDGDIDGDMVVNAEDSDVDGDGVSNGSDDDVDGDGVANADDETSNGRNTNVGLSSDDDSLKGAAMNCFEEECSQDEKKDFFEDLIEKRKGGALGEFYEGVQANIIDFIVRLYEQGYSIEELTQDSMARGLAVRIAGEVLTVRGNITHDQIEGMDQIYYPDVDNTDLEGKTINLLSALDVVGGYPDGNFHSKTPSNLVEGVKIIVNTAAVVSSSQIGSVLQKAMLSDGTVDWFFPFLKTLDQLNIKLISERINGYQDYEALGLDMDIITFLLLFDLLSEIIGIEDVLSFSLPMNLG